MPIDCFMIKVTNKRAEGKDYLDLVCSKLEKEFVWKCPN